VTKKVLPFAVDGKGEDKAIPLQAWTGLEGSSRLSSQISRQSAHEGDKFVSPTHRPPLPPGKILGTHFCWRSESTPWP
jgi:hypothetical protein